MHSFSIRTPADFDLKRDVCSYGYFLLAPNFWNVKDQSLSRVLDLPDGPNFIVVRQAGGIGKPIRVNCFRPIDRLARNSIESAMVRMLRLDESAEIIRNFHQCDSRRKLDGRGRIFRSPTLFEDVIKTVTSCNVTWPATVHMNRRICETLGSTIRLAPGIIAHGFPSPAKLARTAASTLRARCRVGYRDQRIIELAKLFVKADTPRGLPLQLIENVHTSDDSLHDALIELPGIGPYAAANIMQLLGRYGHLPLDTESVRHGRTILGFEGTAKSVMKAVKAYFEPFADQAFRAYWFELWAAYEAKNGPAWTWERDSTGMMFTASLQVRS